MGVLKAEFDRPNNFWATNKCCIFKWMMTNTNRDFIKSAHERDLQMLDSCTIHAADQEYSEEGGDTALHIVLGGVWNYDEYLAEAKRLGVSVNLEMRVRCNMKSKLKPRTKEARKQLRADIKEWNERHLQDMEMVETLIMKGFADPRIQNDAGKSAVDAACNADPEIIEILEDRIRFLEEQEAIEATEEEEDLAYSEKVQKIGGNMF